MIKIKVMADYECFPLWYAGEEVGNINPSHFKISNELKNDLLAWAESFNATLDKHNPLNSGFKTNKEYYEFDKLGELLTSKLNDELGAKYSIIYHPQIVAPIQNQIREKLLATFSPTHLEIFDESYKHAGHAGAAAGSSETHIGMIIVSDKFAGLSRLERSRTVHSAIAEEIKKIHAITVLKTITTDEYSSSCEP